MDSVTGQVIFEELNQPLGTRTVGQTGGTQNRHLDLTGAPPEGDMELLGWGWIGLVWGIGWYRAVKA